MEKGWHKKFNDIHTKIMDGHRRGVCNMNGESTKVNGVVVAKSRTLGYHKTLCNRCHTWYYGEHNCDN